MTTIRDCNDIPRRPEDVATSLETIARTLPNRHASSLRSAASILRGMAKGDTASGEKETP